MTRLVLGSGLAGLALVLALATAVIQSRNRERALALDALKEECDMLEAANGRGCELILAQDWGPLPIDREEPSRSESLDARRPAEGVVVP